MRRHLTIWASLSLVAAVLASIVAGATPGAQAQSPTPYSGDGAANLIEVHAAGPLLAGLDIADVILSPVSTGVDSEAAPQSVADGANLDAALLGEVDLSEILTQAHQEALPDNPEPTVDQLLEVPADPVLNVGVSTSSAHARWNADGTCLPAGESIATGYNETLGADVLQADAVTVASVNKEGGVSSTESDVFFAGDGAVRGLVSESTTQIDTVTLLAGTPLELDVQVASTPTLTATATGEPGGASVVYNNPSTVVIDVPDGSPLAPLEGLNDVTDAVIEDTVLDQIVGGLLGPDSPLNPLDPVLNVEVLVGEETLVQNVAADGTHADGSASVVSLHLTLLAAAGDPLIDLTLDIGPMTAGVTVPVGGIDCTPPLDDNPLRDVHKDVTQAEVPPGGQFDYTLTIPNRGPCTLTDVVVTDTVTAPPGTTITSDPAADTTDGTTFTWNLGTLEPNQTETITMTVQVPDDAPDGFVFSDELTAAGDCDGTPVDHTVTLDAPEVSDDFTGPCDLSQSNKSASHLEVMEGQTFNYFVHVFNQGAEDCTGVEVVDTLHDEVSFVSCEYNCTNDGQTVTWSGLTVPGGSGVTLAVTVTNNAAIGTTLDNSATIDSPDDPDGPHTVTHTGPEVTDRSVPAPPKPAVRGEQKGPLPRTGAELPIALGAFGLLALGFLALRRRLSSIA